MVGASSNFRHHDFPTLFFPFQFHFSLCCVCGTFPLPPPFSLHPLCQIISARLYSPPLQSFLVTAQKEAPNECAEKDDALHCQMQNRWKFFSVLITRPVKRCTRTLVTLLQKEYSNIGKKILLKMECVDLKLVMDLQDYHILALFVRLKEQYM